MITTERLPDWPPAEGEPIGIERARQYIAWIVVHVPPLIEEAKRLITEQNPGAEPHTSSANVSQLATWGLSAGMAGLSIGSVWAKVHAGDFAMCDVSIRRDGRLEMKPRRYVTG